MKKLVASGTAAVVAAGALAAPSVWAATKTVQVKDNRFAPKSITVRKGTKVKWVWRGQAPHNVKVIKGPAKFTSKTQVKGSYSRKLARKGTYTILCTIHAPKMRMTSSRYVNLTVRMPGPTWPKQNQRASSAVLWVTSFASTRAGSRNARWAASKPMPCFLRLRSSLSLSQSKPADTPITISNGLAAWQTCRL